METAATSSGTSCRVIVEQPREDVIPYILRCPTASVAPVGTTPVTQTGKLKHVQWAEETVDNEHLNKRKSKKCCIYHKPRQFDESDSDDSDSEASRSRRHHSAPHAHSHGQHMKDSHESAMST